MHMEKYGVGFPPLMTFNLDDRGSGVWPHFKEHSMTYHRDEPERKAFCGPDWTFWHWPSSRVNNSEETFRMILEAGESKPLVDKVAWYGSKNSAGPNSREGHTRRALVDHYGKVNNDRFDFVHVGDKAGQENYMSMPELTRRYRYLIDVGGAGYSGRTKFLMFSGRPLLMVYRRYIEYFDDDLKPWVHYIPVKEDLSDLIKMHDWLRDNDSKATEIAENAKKYAVENFSMEKGLERLREVCVNFTKEQNHPDPTRATNAT